MVNIQIIGNVSHAKPLINSINKCFTEPLNKHYLVNFHYMYNHIHMDNLFVPIHAVHVNLQLTHHEV